MPRPISQIREAVVDFHIKEAFDKLPSMATIFTDAVKEQIGYEIDFCEPTLKLSPKRYHSKGQTDIGLFFGGKERVALLIENKIFPPFTFEQPERYFNECSALLSHC